MTLSELTTAFVRLNDDEQLKLFEHLAEHTQYGDEIAEGLRKAAFAYFFGFMDADPAEACADNLIPAKFANQDAWARHAMDRDRVLTHALSRHDDAEAIARPAHFTLGSAAA